MKRVCLVTEELFPLTAGGIGRLTFNRVTRALERGDDIEFHLLVPKGRAICPAAVASLFEGRVHCHEVALDLNATPSEEDRALRYPPAAAFTDSRRHGESFRIFRALKRLEASRSTSSSFRTCAAGPFARCRKRSSAGPFGTRRSRSGSTRPSG